MNLEVEVIRRAVKDLDGGSSNNQQSSLQYLNSNNFVNDCKASAIDHLWVQREVQSAMGEEGVRRKYLINKLSNDLIFYN